MFPHIPFSQARLWCINTTINLRDKASLSGAFIIPNPFRKKHEGFILPINLDYILLLSASFPERLWPLALQVCSGIKLASLKTSKHCWEEGKNHQLCVLDYCKGVINYAGFGICYATHGCLIAGWYDLWEQPRFNYWFLINYLYSPFILCQVMKSSDEQRGPKTGFSDHETNWDFQREIKRKETTSEVAPVGGVRLQIH